MGTGAGQEGFTAVSGVGCRTYAEPQYGEILHLTSASSSPHGSKINLPGFWINRYRQLIEEGRAFGFGLLALNEAEIRIPTEVFESVVSSIRFHAPQTGNNNRGAKPRKRVKDRPWQPIRRSPATN